MVTYPVHVQRNTYKGNDPRKKARRADENQIALLLEQYINGRLREQKRPIQQYLYHEISEATGVDLETVREMCFGIDGGHNGFTAWKQGMTMEQAMDAASRGEGLDHE